MEEEGKQWKRYAKVSDHNSQMANKQVAIGWRHFMEGMICRSMRKIQYNFHHQEGTWMSSTCWAQGMILKLLKATHGQWIYCNIQIHDVVARNQAMLQKEDIQRDIKKQMELGEAGLLEGDHWMMKVNLGDMENTSGEQDEYLLLAIKATRVAAMLARRQYQTALPTQIERGIDI
jgi:hypothetical protein